MALIRKSGRALFILAALITSWAGHVAAEMTFVHPGALNTRASLDFVKTRLEAGQQPWKDAFSAVQQLADAPLPPGALEYIDSTSDDASISRDAALHAYALALSWYFTGDENYARRSITILDEWSGLKGFNAGTEQDRLQAGWIGSVFAQAAEIMRIYPGWTVDQIAGFQNMFRRAFYPQLNTPSFWNGNVDLTQIDAMISIAVFNEDEAQFNRALARLERRNPAYFYLSSDGRESLAIEGDRGDVDAFWSDPVHWPDGLTQETCRDNGHHAQFALGSAVHVAEVAWNQGVDVYSKNMQRYTAALELLASQLLSGNVDSCHETTATTSRFSTWEVGYNHYHHRSGFDLTYTQELITQQIRTPDVHASWNLAFETLTHADISE